MPGDSINCPHYQQTLHPAAAFPMVAVSAHIRQ